MSFTCMSHDCHMHATYRLYACHMHVSHSHACHMSFTCISHACHIQPTCMPHVVHMHATCRPHACHMSSTCMPHVVYMHVRAFPFIAWLLHKILWCLAQTCSDVALNFHAISVQVIVKLPSPLGVWGMPSRIFVLPGARCSVCIVFLVIVIRLKPDWRLHRWPGCGIYVVFLPKPSIFPSNPTSSPSYIA